MSIMIASHDKFDFISAQYVLKLWWKAYVLEWTINFELFVTSDDYHYILHIVELHVILRMDVLSTSLLCEFWLWPVSPVRQNFHTECLWVKSKTILT